MKALCKDEGKVILNKHTKVPPEAGSVPFKPDIHGQ